MSGLQFFGSREVFSFFCGFQLFLVIMFQAASSPVSGAPAIFSDSPFSGISGVPPQLTSR
jgi:hypothetical protein